MDSFIYAVGSKFHKWMIQQCFATTILVPPVDVNSIGIIEGGLAAQDKAVMLACVRRVGRRNKATNKENR